MFRPLFFGGSPNSLWKKNVRPSNGQGSPKIIEIMTEVDIFNVEKYAFLMYEIWFQIDSGRVSGRFWDSEEGCDILNLKKTPKNSLSGNASDLWRHSYL